MYYPASHIRLSKSVRGVVVPRGRARPAEAGCCGREARSIVACSRDASRPSLESGGDSGARTRSLRLAKPALSQLSYIPASAERSELIEPEALVGLGGLEPPTSRLSGVRSNQLSYRPTPRIDAEEIEPAETSAAPTALPRPDPQEGSQPGRTRTWKRPPGWDSSRRHTTSGLQKERE